MCPAKSPSRQTLPGSQFSGSSILPFPQTAPREDEDLRLEVLLEEEEEREEELTLRQFTHVGSAEEL
jgi:hypothetical protein